MRHRTVTSTFGRSSAHRQATLSALACSLILEKRIKTTLPRAKAARVLAEKMVTLAKTGTLASRKQAVSALRRKNVVKVLFDDIAPKCRDRAGGYIRITRIGRRRNDSADMAVMEWVSISPVDKKKKKEPKEETPAADDKKA